METKAEAEHDAPAQEQAEPNALSDGDSVGIEPPSTVAADSNNLDGFDSNGQAAAMDGEADKMVGNGKILSEGSTVCFYAPGSQLMTVRNKGKYWELLPLGVSDVAYNAEGTMRLQFYPPEATFTVMRKGKHVGFRSIVADGKTLQAMAGDNTPHRVCNYNFGDWESWELTPDGYVNVKWRSKPLGFEVREVRAIGVDTIKGAERGHLKQARHIQHKLKGTEVKLQDSERKIRDLSRQAERQNKLHQNEMGELRNRLEDALQAKQKLEIEKVQLNATLKQQEMRVTQLVAEKEIMETSCSHAEKRLQSLHREIQAARDRHDAEMKRMDNTHSSEIAAISREREVELKRRVEHYESKIHRLQEDSQQQNQRKDDEVGKLKEVIDAKIGEKDFEINSLMEECSRLNSTLQTIKAQLDQANKAKASLQVTNIRFAAADGRRSPAMGGSGRMSPDVGRCRSPIRSRPSSPMRSRPSSPLYGRPSSPLVNRPRSRGPISDHLSHDLEPSCSFSKGMGANRPSDPLDFEDSDEEVDAQPTQTQRASSNMTEASLWSYTDGQSRQSFEEEAVEVPPFQFPGNQSPLQNQRGKIRTMHLDESNEHEVASEVPQLNGYTPAGNIDYELVTPRLIAPQAAVLRQQRR